MANTLEAETKGIMEAFRDNDLLQQLGIGFDDSGHDRVTVECYPLDFQMPAAPASESLENAGIPATSQPQLNSVINGTANQVVDEDLDWLFTDCGQTPDASITTVKPVKEGIATSSMLSGNMRMSENVDQSPPFPVPAPSYSIMTTREYGSNETELLAVVKRLKAEIRSRDACIVTMKKLLLEDKELQLERRKQNERQKELLEFKKLYQDLLPSYKCLEAEVQRLRVRVASDQSLLDQQEALISSLQKETVDLKNKLETCTLPIKQKISAEMKELKRTIKKYEDEIDSKNATIAKLRSKSTVGEVMAEKTDLQHVSELMHLLRTKSRRRITGDSITNRVPSSLSKRSYFSLDSDTDDGDSINLPSCVSSIVSPFHDDSCDDNIIGCGSLSPSSSMGAADDSAVVCQNGSYAPAKNPNSDSILTDVTATSEPSSFCNLPSPPSISSVSSTTGSSASSGKSKASARKRKLSMKEKNEAATGLSSSGETKKSDVSTAVKSPIINPVAPSIPSDLLADCMIAATGKESPEEEIVSKIRRSPRKKSAVANRSNKMLESNEVRLDIDKPELVAASGASENFSRIKSIFDLDEDISTSASVPASPNVVDVATDKGNGINQSNSSQMADTDVSVDFSDISEAGAPTEPMEDANYMRRCVNYPNASTIPSVPVPPINHRPLSHEVKSKPVRKLTSMITRSASALSESDSDDEAVIQKQDFNIPQLAMTETVKLKSGPENSAVPVETFDNSEEKRSPVATDKQTSIGHRISARARIGRTTDIIAVGSGENMCARKKIETLISQRHHAKQKPPGKVGNASSARKNILEEFVGAGSSSSSEVLKNQEVLVVHSENKPKENAGSIPESNEQNLLLPISGLAVSPNDGNGEAGGRQVSGINEGNVRSRVVTRPPDTLQKLINKTTVREQTSIGHRISARAKIGRTTDIIAVGSGENMCARKKIEALISQRHHAKQKLPGKVGNASSTRKNILEEFVGAGSRSSPEVLKNQEVLVVHSENKPKEVAESVSKLIEENSNLPIDDHGIPVIETSSTEEANAQSKTGRVTEELSVSGLRDDFYLSSDESCDENSCEAKGQSSSLSESVQTISIAKASTKEKSGEGHTFKRNLAEDDIILPSKNGRLQNKKMSMIQQRILKRATGRLQVTSQRGKVLLGKTQKHASIDAANLQENVVTLSSSRKDVVTSVDDVVPSKKVRMSRPSPVLRPCSRARLALPDDDSSQRAVSSHQSMYETAIAVIKSAKPEENLLTPISQDIAIGSATSTHAPDSDGTEANEIVSSGSTSEPKKLSMQSEPVSARQKIGNVLAIIPVGSGEAICDKLKLEMLTRKASYNLRSRKEDGGGTHGPAEDKVEPRDSLLNSSKNKHPVSSLAFNQETKCAKKCTNAFQAEETAVVGILRGRRSKPTTSKNLMAELRKLNALSNKIPDESCVSTKSYCKIKNVSATGRRPQSGAEHAVDPCCTLNGTIQEMEQSKKIPLRTFAEDAALNLSSEMMPQNSDKREGNIDKVLLKELFGKEARSILAEQFCCKFVSLSEQLRRPPVPTYVAKRVYDEVLEISLLHVSKKIDEKEILGFMKNLCEKLQWMQSQCSSYQNLDIAVVSFFISNVLSKEEYIIERDDVFNVIGIAYGTLFREYGFLRLAEDAILTVMLRRTRQKFAFAQGFLSACPDVLGKQNGMSEVARSAIFLALAAAPLYTDSIYFNNVRDILKDGLDFVIPQIDYKGMILHIWNLFKGAEMQEDLEEGEKVLTMLMVQGRCHTVGEIIEDMLESIRFEWCEGGITDAVFAAFLRSIVHSLELSQAETASEVSLSKLRSLFENIGSKSASSPVLEEALTFCKTRVEQIETKLSAKGKAEPVKYFTHNDLRAQHAIQAKEDKRNRRRVKRKIRRACAVKVEDSQSISNVPVAVR